MSVLFLPARKDASSRQTGPRHRKAQATRRSRAPCGDCGWRRRGAVRQAGASWPARNRLALKLDQLGYALARKRHEIEERRLGEGLAFGRSLDLDQAA